MLPSARLDPVLLNSLYFSNGLTAKLGPCWSRPAGVPPPLAVHAGAPAPSKLGSAPENTSGPQPIRHNASPRTSGSRLAQKTFTLAMLFEAGRGLGRSRPAGIPPLTVHAGAPASSKLGRAPENTSGTQPIRHDASPRASGPCLAEKTLTLLLFSKRNGVPAGAGRRGFPR